MSGTAFHTAFVLVMLAFIGLRGYYQTKAVRARGPAEYKEGRSHFLVRLVLGIPLLLLLTGYMLRPSLLSWAQFSLPPALQWLGVALGILSIGLLIWVHEALGVNFSRTLHIRAEHTLVTAGPYRWVRHPMYTMLFLLGVAILLLTANWLIGGFFLGSFFLTVFNRVANEEQAMIEKFGNDYEQYRQRTKRFVPGLI